MRHLLAVALCLLAAPAAAAPAAIPRSLESAWGHALTGFFTSPIASEFVGFEGFGPRTSLKTLSPLTSLLAPQIQPERFGILDEHDRASLVGRALAQVVAEVANEAALMVLVAESPKSPPEALRDALERLSGIERHYAAYAAAGGVSLEQLSAARALAGRRLSDLRNAEAERTLRAVAASLGGWEEPPSVEAAVKELSRHRGRLDGKALKSLDAVLAALASGDDLLAQDRLLLELAGTLGRGARSRDLAALQGLEDLFGKADLELRSLIAIRVGGAAAKSKDARFAADALGLLARLHALSRGDTLLLRIVQGELESVSARWPDLAVRRLEYPEYVDNSVADSVSLPVSDKDLARLAEVQPNRWAAVGWRLPARAMVELAEKLGGSSPIARAVAKPRRSARPAGLAALGLLAAVLLYELTRAFRAFRRAL